MDLYLRLREQLDNYSIGFPATESGVEIKILKKLFTPDEAELFLVMSMMLEDVDSIASRFGRDAAEVSRMLEGMFEKGLVFRVKRKESYRYAASAYVVGIYEFQLGRMDKELAELTEQYFSEGFHARIAGKTVPMRTVPVNRAINVSWPVAPHEDIKAIIRSKELIAVAKCICRVQQGLLEKPCDKPLEVCFSFGSHAQYYVERGMARYISKEEALEIIDRCEEAGLVPQPFNAKNPGGVCNCCGDCCGILRALNLHPRPAEMVTSNYYAEAQSELCISCEVCTGRCQMRAITMVEKKGAVVNKDRCIGCGLCVVTCPTEALKLRPKDERKDPPENSYETMLRMVEERGKSIIPLSLLRNSK